MGGIVQAEQEVDREISFFKVMTLDRLRMVLNEALGHETWYWVECSLCLSRTVFQSASDLREWMKYGYCRCEYKFDRTMSVGNFPGGRVYVYDDERVR
jgi:hypothetical protein